MFSPVPHGVQVVRSVVSIIERVAVALEYTVSQCFCNITLPPRYFKWYVHIHQKTYRNVNERDARSVVRVWLLIVDKGVLAPIAHHHTQTHQDKGDQKDANGCLPVVLEGRVQQHVAAQLPEEGLGGESVPLARDKVERQLGPDQHDEAADVVQKVPERVPLVAHGGGQISGAVALDVVVLDVVVKVGIPRVSHERVEQVGERVVKEAEALVQDTAHMNVLVHHQRVGAHVGQLHQRVQDSVNPSKGAKEEESGTRDRGGKVQQQVRQHHHICLDPHNGPGGLNVVLQHVLVEWPLPVNAIVIRALKDCGLKIRTRRIIEAIEVR